MIYFSKDTLGFYDDAVHSPLEIPEDAVEITPEKRQAMLQAESTGEKTISFGSLGEPILIDRVLTESEARSKRNTLLNDSDWIVIRSIDTGKPIPLEWSVYRQKLRDIPQQKGFPGSINWPNKPFKFNL